MNSIIAIVFLISILGLSYAGYNFFKVKSLDEGTAEMSEIASAIRLGANTFLKKEYKVLFIAIIVVAIIESVVFFIPSGIAFIIGSIMSASAGFLGMKAATYANVRVANTARLTKKVGKTVKVDARGGSVNGLSTAGFSLIGLVIILIIFKGYFHNVDVVVNWLNISFIPFTMIVSSYGLGCSIVALFFRVGGGIYTKSADMGADLVGKTEENIPEDDPRNPAVIADCVGDNVGDTAGLGSDLLESNVGSIVSAAMTPVYITITLMSSGIQISQALREKMILYPIGYSAFGLLSCIIGLAFILAKKDGKDPHKELNLGTWISAGLAGIINFFFTIFLFSGENIGDLGFFKFGILSPWIASVVGIASGIIIGMIAEYYTSYDYGPTKKIAKASKMGVALNITQGLSGSMKSNLASCLIIGFGVYISSQVCGTYGIAMAAVGMLSFVGMTVTVDTYGPISDNAGGIAEMANLPSEVRKITDQLDAVGNTTAAIGKGFAIGSAAYATISLLNSYMYSFVSLESVNMILNVLDARILFGVIIGGAVIWYFSGMLIESVSKCAEKMVGEVRRQFNEIKGLREGKTKPDYKKCIEIATNGALAEMKAPAIIAIVIPVLGGFLFGPNFVAGILFGAIMAAILLAIFFGNSGGAWDNAKKYIEAQGSKGSEEHVAAVVGDTVGDPLKDTAGPSLDIFIKIMNTVSLVFVNFFKVVYLFK